MKIENYTAMKTMIRFFTVMLVPGSEYYYDETVHLSHKLMFILTRIRLFLMNLFFIGIFIFLLWAIATIFGGLGHGR